MSAPLTVAVVGDVLPLRPLFSGSGAAHSHGLTEILEILGSADLAFGNFEMPLTEREEPVEKLLNIKAPPELAPHVARLGFDVVNVANNHAVDYGCDGLADTVESLRDAGLPCIGFGADRTAAALPWSSTARGRQVAIVPFSCLLPTGMAASDDRPGISPIHVATAYEIDALYQAEEPGDVACVTVRTSAQSVDVAWAAHQIEEAKATHDVVLASIHWGFGSGEGLADYQQPLAHALLDAGADAILGHHPHAIHAIEFHDGKPILYSPGTFIGQQKFLDASPQVKAMWAGMSTDSYAALLVADDDGWRVRVVPIVLDDDALPTRAREQDFRRIHERLERLSTPLGAAIKARGHELEARPLTRPAPCANGTDPPESRGGSHVG